MNHNMGLQVCAIFQSAIGLFDSVGAGGDLLVRIELYGDGGAGGCAPDRHHELRHNSGVLQ